jgi:hypothetical protein
MGDRLCALADHLRFEIVRIGVGRLQEVIDIGIATENFQIGGYLRERRGGFCPGIADVIKRGCRHGRLPVVRYCRSIDLHKWKQL